MHTSDEIATPALLRPNQREVFLSYARSDHKIAWQLDDRLKAAGRTTWIDRSGIEPTEEWLAAIHAGIDRSDNFVLLVSPRSVASPWCAREVEAAAARNKRLIPVLVEPTDPASLPPLMAARQWIDCATDFDAGLARLIKALDRDLAYVHEHTRLLGRAIDWKSGRGGLLTRGELAPAERWLAGAQAEPAPTPLHAELIVTSRRAATRTQWQIIAAATVAVVIATGLAIFAFQKRDEAQRQTAAATRNLADTTAARAVSEAKPREALRGAARAADFAVTAATRDALLRVLQRTDQLRFTFDPASKGVHLQALALDPAGTQLAALPYHDDIQSWDLRSGASRNAPGTSSIVPQPIALTGNLIAQGGEVWRSGEKTAFFTVPDPGEIVANALTADRIAVAGPKGVMLCGLDGTPCKSFAKSDVQSLAFTGARGEWLAAASANAVDILDGRTLAPLRSWPLSCSLAAMGGSASTAALTVVLSDMGVCTIDVPSDSFACSEQNEMLHPTVERVYGVPAIAESLLAVSAGGRLLAITDYQMGVGFTDVDNSISVWDASRRRGELLPLRHRIYGDVRASSADGSTVVVRDAKRRVIRMDAATATQAGQPFTPAGQVVACSNDHIAAMNKKDVTVYDAQTGRVAVRMPRPGPESAMFSPDGKLLAIRTERGVRFHAIPSGGQTGKELPIGGRELAFVPSRHAVLTTDGTSLEEWDIDTGVRTVRKLQAGTQTNWDDDDAGIELFAVSTDGKRVATNGGGHAEGMAPRLVLWDLERGTVIASQRFTDQVTTITSIAFGNDVIATVDDTNLRLFDAATLTPLGENIKLDESHDFRTTCTARVFADGSHAGAVCDDAAFTYSMQIRDWQALALLRAR